MGHLVTKRSNFGSINLVVMVAIATAMVHSIVAYGSVYRPSNSYTPSSDYSPPTDDSSYDPSTDWLPAHATFYGDETASETMGGACGYGNLFASGYDLETTALSSALYQNGQACGRCYEIKCVGTPSCLPGASSIKVTATNLCPPNWSQPSDNGGWCNPPRAHFDLSKPMFMQLAIVRAGIVPVNYRRVPCVRQGGIVFKITGNAYWLLVYVMNMAGSGDITQIWVKGSDTDWIMMTNNWGSSFQAFAKFGNQALSFKITDGDGNTIICNNVAPQYWSTGNSYQATNNFY